MGLLTDAPTPKTTAAGLSTFSVEIPLFLVAAFSAYLLFLPRLISVKTERIFGGRWLKTMALYLTTLFPHLSQSLSTMVGRRRAWKYQ